jgi:hypothetical protein
MLTERRKFLSALLKPSAFVVELLCMMELNLEGKEHIRTFRG